MVFISPEMLLTRQFIRNVLQNPEFGRRILSVVVDEAHVVFHWGNEFRKKYGTVGMVRAFLPKGTPIIPMSATMSTRIRRDVLSKLGIKKGSYEDIDIGNDRPNVSLVVLAIEHPMNTFADLDFVIPDVVGQAGDIPKTMIYADDIAAGTGIMDRLATRVPESLRESGIIRPYNALQSVEYRAQAMQVFREGKIRVLVCTDAAGMVSCARSP